MTGELALFLDVPGNSVKADLGPVAAGGVKRSPTDSSATTVPGQHLVTQS